jgi:hypothetical protein
LLPPGTTYSLHCRHSLLVSSSPLHHATSASNSCLYLYLCSGVEIVNKQIHLQCYLHASSSTSQGFTPEQLSTLVLSYLKQSAEEYLRRKPIRSCPPLPGPGEDHDPATSDLHTPTGRLTSSAPFLSNTSLMQYPATSSTHHRQRLHPRVDSHLQGGAGCTRQLQLQAPSGGASGCHSSGV